MSSYAIEIRGIHKKFENSENYSVNNVTLDIEQGSFVTILGTSGSGKTTLLKMINRIYEPSSGDIFFFGENMIGLDVREYRKKIGYVIQQIGLFPHMTVAENIATVPKSLKWDKERIRRRVDELLELVHLPAAEYRERYPSQLSGGQQQRVGLARAMAAEPAVMLMDEPFGAIDSITRKILQDELLSIQRKLGKTILFVTHDIHEAFKLGDKVIIMDAGEVQQYDIPYNILFHPANEFVSRLIESDNILEKLQLLRAGDFADPLTREPAPADKVRVRSDESLGDVLGKFLEGGLSSVLVTNDGGDVLGRISWDKFQSVSLLSKGEVEYYV